MISDKSTKRELHSLSPDMASLMETVIVQGTEEEWTSVLFPADVETNQAAFATVSHIYEATQRGVKCIYELYTEEERAADESKKQAKLIYSPGKTGMPFVFLTPGGAFLMVDFLGEGLPQAHELNKLGYHVFLLKYRVGLPDTLSLALEDVHRALQLILSVRKDLGIDTTRYASMGNSAGGYLAGEWGVRELGYGKYGDPKPSSVLLAYPACSLQCCYEDYLRGDPDESFMFVMPLYLKNILGDGFTLEDTKRLSLEYQIDEAYSPVFVVWNEDDEYVHKDGFYRLKDRIEQSGIPHEIEIYPSGRHGFGAGYRVQARGWVERAIRFWESSTETQHD